MITHRVPVAARRARRALTLVLGVLSMVVIAALPASAGTPTTWEDAPHVSGLHALTILILIPLVLMGVISLLAALPSMIGGKPYETGQAWRSEGEWFGGPRKGVEAADEVAPEELTAASDKRGGASAEW